ncbi:MAG: alpha/beta fold hydrolase [Oricola sp.]
MTAETPPPRGPAILACRKVGDADRPALVLLHGFGGSGHHFDSVAGELSGIAQIYLPDLPGHGQSRAVPGSRHAKAAAEAVLATLWSLGRERFHLAGFSFGGAVACLVALTAPERVLSLTLLAPGGFGPEIAAGELRAFAVARTRQELTAGLEGMMAPGAPVAQAELAQLVRERADGALVTELAAIAAAITRDGRQGAIPRSELARIACPVRVVWGSADPVLPVSQSADLPPQFDLRIVPGAGHMLADEAREAVLDALRASVSS